MSEGPPAAASAKMKADLIAVIPNLRAFAVSLCGNPDRADDLVQETLVKAWSNLGSFVEGTNLPAWLFTILRNIYYSEYRKRRREVADSDGTIVAYHIDFGDGGSATNNTGLFTHTYTTPGHYVAVVTVLTPLQMLLERRFARGTARAR